MKQEKKKSKVIIKPKVDHIYYVSNRDLRIKRENGTYRSGGHNVIVTSINKSNNTVRVKTITSIEKKKQNSNKYTYDIKTLDSAKKGRILPIPRKEINSKLYSAIDHKSIVISISKLNRTKDRLRFPKRYRHLIHRK